ncbi:MAG: sigma-54 dependent transcriptional regulator [Rubrivivax sp.]|nr:sigma-54 dependent transcriptional regulator [Rubrivivax sp.]
MIDDEAAVRQILAAAVTEAGHTVERAGTMADARSKLARGDVDVALCDIKLPDGNGIDLVRESKAARRDTAFIMVTGCASMETAVEALRAGAADFVTKPVHNEEMLHRIAQIEALGGLREQNRTLRRVVSENEPKLYRFTCAGMLEVERLVAKVAPTPSTVLITGESGTGKGIVARMIHELSPRHAGPFLAINCSAIPEHLLESEFFGHAKGAFTSAVNSHKGLFQQAENGTLFLDEIGELPIRLQSKLLNVIEDKEVRPVGGEQVRRVDTRIIAATNRNLQDAVTQGTFRNDLFFRLGMFQIAIPPLRDRQSDIPALVRFLLSRGQPSGVAEALSIDPLAEEVLLAHHWPGNVRELDNVINRARILAEDHCVMIADLPAALLEAARPTGVAGLTSLDAAGTLRDRIRRCEAEILRGTLADAGGDRKLAAQRLGIHLSSLYRKLDEHDFN